MNIAKRPLTLAFFFALCSLLTCSWSSAADKTQTTNAGVAEQKECDLVRKRLRAHEDLLTAASWTLCHCADEKQVKAVERTLNLLPAFAETNGFTKLVQAGGIKTSKANVAAFLQNKDPVVRGFGAILLAVIGDAAYKTDIANLLADKHGSPPKEEARLLWNFDRSPGGNGSRPYGRQRIRPEAVGTTYFKVRIKLHPVVAESQQRLVARAVQEWLRLNRSLNGLQQDGPPNGSQPIRSETNRTSRAAGSRR